MRLVRRLHQSDSRMDVLWSCTIRINPRVWVIEDGFVTVLTPALPKRKTTRRTYHDSASASVSAAVNRGDELVSCTHRKRLTEAFNFQIAILDKSDA